MEIKQVFSTIKQWIWLILLGCVIGGGVGFFVSSRQTPVYQAQARFVILPAAQTTYDYYSYLSNQDLISTYAELLTTEDLLYQASNELGFPVLKGQATASQVGDTKFVLQPVQRSEHLGIWVKVYYMLFFREDIEQMTEEKRFYRCIQLDQVIRLNHALKFSYCDLFNEKKCVKTPALIPFIRSGLVHQPQDKFPFGVKLLYAFTQDPGIREIVVRADSECDHFCLPSNKRYRTENKQVDK